MKTIKGSTMPDGTMIFLEDWRDDYPEIYENYTIGAYPIAQRTSKSGFIQGGRIFRITINRWDSDDNVEQIFLDLENGNITLESLADHFWNCEKDKWCLGMDVKKPWQ